MFKSEDCSMLGFESSFCKTVNFLVTIHFIDGSAKELTSQFDHKISYHNCVTALSIPAVFTDFSVITTRPHAHSGNAR